jgi:hypothetical protein
LKGTVCLAKILTFRDRLLLKPLKVQDIRKIRVVVLQQIAKRLDFIKFCYLHTLCLIVFLFWPFQGLMAKSITRPRLLGLIHEAGETGAGNDRGTSGLSIKTSGELEPLRVRRSDPK